MSLDKQYWSTWIIEPLLSNSKLIFIESLILIIALWSIFALGLGWSNEISSPILVAVNSYELWRSGDWIIHFRDTLWRVALAFVLTMIIGTILGVLIGMYDFWMYAFQDYVTVGLALPGLFAVIWAAMWFGVNDLTPMVAGAIISFPFLTQEVYEAVKDIDNDLLQMANAFGVSRSRAVRRIVVQSILPQWFGGVRYSFSNCWKITTLAELVAAGSGIGFMIEFELNRRSITGVLTWTILFTVLMLFIEYGILRQIEERIFDWREEATIGWG